LKIYKKLKVLCIAKDLNSTIFIIRIKTPLELWKKKFKQEVKLVQLNNISKTNLFWPDIVIFQRTMSDIEIQLANFLKKNQKKLVYEIDDLLTRIPSYLSRTNFTINKFNIIKIINISDALSVSTCNLKSQFKNKNNNIHVTPNYSSPMKSISKHYFVKTKDIKLIISSTDNVLLNMIIPALAEVQKKFGVQIISIGPICLQLKKAGIRIDENLNFRHYEFKNFISSIDNAIGLIPLNLSLFNNCKSPIKFFDYSACGIPSICSNVPPYSQVIKKNFSGLLAENTKKSWIKNIYRLITDENLRSFLSKNAIVDIKQNYNINKNMKSWNNLLSSIKISNISKNYKNKKKIIRFIPQMNFYFSMQIFCKNIFNTHFYINTFRLLRQLGLRKFYNKIFYS
jgi:glycosyltransferase involved in cell wall biosynthesis